MILPYAIVVAPTVISIIHCYWVESAFEAVAKLSITCLALLLLLLLLLLQRVAVRFVNEVVCTVLHLVGKFSYLSCTQKNNNQCGMVRTNRGLFLLLFMIPECHLPYDNGTAITHTASSGSKATLQMENLGCPALSMMAISIHRIFLATTPPQTPACRSSPTCNFWQNNYSTVELSYLPHEALLLLLSTLKCPTYLQLTTSKNRR